MKKGIIITVIVTFLLAGIGSLIYFLYFSPKQRVLRAINKGDYDMAYDILAEDGEIGSNDEVRDTLKERIISIQDRFINEETDYISSMEEIASIRKMKIIGMKDALNEVEEYIGRLNTSRTDFEIAEALFEQKSYPEAMEKYKLVIEEDPKYETARNRLNEAVSQYRDDYLNLAKQKADAEDYQGAMDALTIALQVLPEDLELTKQLALYQNEKDNKELNQFLANAEEKASEEAYETAISIIQAALYQFPDSEVLKQRLKLYQDTKADKELNQFLADAEEKAGEEAYELAISIIQSGLIQFPDSEELKQRLQLYQNADEAQKRQSFLASVAEKADKGQYTSAISSLDSFITNHPDDTEVKELRQTYYNQYIDSVIKEADQMASAQDYIGALTLLGKALSSFPEDSKLIAKRDDYQNSDIQRIISNSQEKLVAGDYRGSIVILEDGLKQYKNNDKLTTLLEANKEKHIQYFLEKAQSSASEENYTSAVATIKEGLASYPNDSRLKAKEEEYTAKLPVPFNDIRVINGGFNWNDGAPEDTFGNDYSTAANYTIVKNQDKYSEIRIYGSYKMITGRIACHNYMHEDKSVYIQIFADDQLIYTSQNITRKTDAVDFSIDISGADYLKIIVYADAYWGGKAIILSDVFLIPN